MKDKLAIASVVLCVLSMASTTALAQEELENIGPAVDTSAPEQVQANAAPTEDVDPAVDTSGGISRSTSGARVMDSLSLGRTEITGNQELPKVMVIVPWKKADPGDLMGKPVNTLLDEVLAPIDREEFVRQVDYYDDLYAESESE